MDRLIIEDSNLVTLIINCMNKVNQVMKKIENNNEGYYVNGFKAYCFDRKNLPRKVECELKLTGLNKKQQALLEPYIEYLNYRVDDGIALFTFIRDFKKTITKIIITEDEFVIQAQLIDYTLKRHDNMIWKKDKVVCDELICDFTVDDLTVLEGFIGHKGIMQLYIDIENEGITINKQPDSDSFLKLVISHKYLKGFSGTNVKADGKSTVTFQVYFTNLSDTHNVFLIKIIPDNSKFNVINEICVIDS